MRLRAAAVGLVLGLTIPRTGHAIDPHKPLDLLTQRLWGTRHGLIQSSVSAINQTQDHYLWFGTRAGLNRFDGVSFKPPPGSGVPPFLIERAVSSLVVDRAGVLWMAFGSQGVVSWNGTSYRQFTSKDGLPSDHINILVPGPDGTLWAGTEHGIGYRKGAMWTSLRGDDAPKGFVSALAIEPDGSGWTVTDEGLLHFKDDKTTRFPDPTLPGDLRVIAIAGPTLWVGGRSGLYRVTDGKVVGVYTTADGLPHSDVRALLIDRHGSLWVGTRGGLARWDGTRFLRYTTQDGLPANSVLSLFEDHEGSLWVGTAGGGITQLKDSALTEILFHDPGPIGTNAVLGDPDGNIWAASERGLAHVQEGKLVQLPVGEGPPREPVWSLGREPDGTMWLGMAQEGRLLRWRRGHDADVTTFDEKSGLPHSSIRVILPARSGGLWIGMNWGYLVRFADGKFTTYQVPVNPRNNVSALLEEPDGSLWVGAGNGVLRFRDGRFESMADDLFRAPAVAFFHDQAGDLWIGTGIGLYRYHAGKFTGYFTRHGLRADGISSIFADDRGRLWFGSPQGIFGVRKQEFDDLDAGRIANLTSVQFGLGDRATSLEVAVGFHPSLWRSDDGALWFPTSIGLAVLDLKQLPHDQAPPSVLIESLAVDGQPMATTGPIDLAPGRNRLEFAFTVPSFLAPETIAFRHKLEGFDDQWVDAGGQRLARYGRVPPGRYRFRVVAESGVGAWAETSAFVDLRLRPYFYQTRWFVAACALLLVTAAFAVHRSRTRRLLEKFLTVLLERNRIAREIHDNLGPSITAVTLRLESAAKTLATAPEESRAQIDKARAELPRSLAETRRAIAMLRSIRLERGGLAPALEECVDQLTVGTGISAELGITGNPGPLPSLVEEHLLRIAQESVGNAIRHGGASKLKVALALAPKKITLTVDDDGRGIDEQAADRPGHFGLRGIRERVGSMHGQVTFGKSPLGGTSLVVTVPLGWRAGIRQWFARRRDASATGR